MTWQTLQRRSGALGLAGALACGPAEGVYEGEHVTVSIDPELVACGDMVGHMHRFVERTAEFLGVGLEGQHFQFFWLTLERFEALSGCSEGVLGCANGTRAAAWAAPLDHELAH